jgi:hypothetical protein
VQGHTRPHHDHDGGSAIKYHIYEHADDGATAIVYVNDLLQCSGRDDCPFSDHVHVFSDDELDAHDRATINATRRDVPQFDDGARPTDAYYDRIRAAARLDGSG